MCLPFDVLSGRLPESTMCSAYSIAHDDTISPSNQVSLEVPLTPSHAARSRQRQSASGTVQATFNTHRSLRPVISVLVLDGGLRSKECILRSSSLAFVGGAFNSAGMQVIQRAY